MTEEKVPTYTTRRAAVAGAKRALEKLGIASPMSEVHFVVVPQLGENARDDVWIWKQMDLKTGLPVGEVPPEPLQKPQEPAASAPSTTGPAADKAPQRASTPPLAGKKPRWAASKSEPPGAKAYRPKPGTSQAQIYDLLTNPAGTDIEWFCSEMNKALKQGTSPWTPSNAWSGLRYLFCHLKGYGLKFDGRLLWLIVPKEEVPYPTKGSESFGLGDQA